MIAPTTPELLGCPFCGGVASPDSVESKSIHWVECVACHIDGELADAPEEAAALWNTRAALAAPASQWVSIDERMPPEDYDAPLWVTPAFDAPVAFATYFGIWRFIDGSETQSMVTHWMPMTPPALPAGPVEQGEQG